VLPLFGADFNDENETTDEKVPFRLLTQALTYLHLAAVDNFRRLHGGEENIRRKFHGYETVA